MDDRPSLSSFRNPEIRRLRRLGSEAGARREEGLFLVEGPAVLSEALRHHVPLREIFVSARLDRDSLGTSLRELLSAGPVPVRTVSEAVLRRAAPTRHGRGILALAPLPAEPDDPTPLLGGDGPLVVLHDVQDPGNVGTLVRLCEALGAAGLVASGGSADPWGPKAVRAAAGSILRLPVRRVAALSELLGDLRREGWRRVAAVARGGRAPEGTDLSGRTALLLGSEGGGLPEPAAAGADLRLTIPLRREVESVNVSTAGAILLWEGLRPRRRESVAPANETEEPPFGP